VKGTACCSREVTKGSMFCTVTATCRSRPPVRGGGKVGRWEWMQEEREREEERKRERDRGDKGEREECNQMPKL